MPEQDDYSLLRSHAGRLTTAASHVNQHYLGTPYGSTPIHGRLLNQRFLIELTNKQGKKLYTENNKFLDAHGVPLTREGEQFKHGNLIHKIRVKDPMSNPLLGSITYEEAYYAIYLPFKVPSGYKSVQDEKRWQKKRDAFLNACDQGQIAVEPNFEALKSIGYTVNHVIHRPNHGLHHSMRAAASIPMILGFFDAKPSAQEVEKLQHMMLFSVVGRLDETGFSETGDYGVGKNTYQGFRSTSGLAYLDYCDSRSDVYTDAEKHQFAPYRDALVVELMGFHDIHNALKAHPGNILSDPWIKERILKDSKRLVEMGTLTEQEALSLDKAADADKERVANELVSVVKNAVPKRYILESSIPEVLVRFIEKNYTTLHTQGNLTTEERQKIDNALLQTEKAAVIKKILPRILADKGLGVFPFINPQSMSNQLGTMNWAHGLDLSRCYSLEAQYYIKIIKMPAEVDLTTPDWESQLTSALSTREELKTVEKQKGYLVIKASNDQFYIRHTDTNGKIQYSKIDGQNDLNLLLTLNMESLPKDTRLRHSQLLFHMAEKNGEPSGKSQYFGNIKGLMTTCFNKSTDWDTFKAETIKLYNFLNGIHQMHLKTGERQNFQLHSKTDFQAFLDLPETKDLYDKFKNNQRLFMAKFTSKAINELCDDRSFENYNYPKAFRIFADAPFVTDKRDYTAEAVNCARLIDSGTKPKHALKTNELPEIQLPRYNPDNKEMTLIFTDLESTNRFQKLYQEVIKLSKGVLSNDCLSITLPLSDYKYLRDNRYLKFKIESVPEKHVEEEDLIDFDTGEYRAIQLIREQRAVIRLHNTLKNKEGTRPYEGELEAMEQPMENRRVAMPNRLQRLLEQPEGKETYINERRKVKHPITRVERVRGVFLESAPPSPQYQQPQIPELDHPDLVSVNLFEEQGGVKNTRFLTKAPYTLLDPTGNTQLFMGALGTRNKYFPIGILSDLEETHKGGGTYIWTGRANSWEKLWLGEDKNKMAPLPQGVSLEELKKLQREGKDRHEHNELLLRSGKVASRSLVAPKNTLIDRLNLAAQAINIKRQFGISLPLMILDPADPGCPKLYTEEMIRQDIQVVVQAVREHELEGKYDNSRIPDIVDGLAGPLLRDRESQNEIITQILSECDFTVSSNPDQSILPEERLMVAPTTPEDTDTQKIERFLQKLSVPGGKLAQRQQIADNVAFDALPTEKKDKFFIKQAALGHLDVIEQLFNTCSYTPNEEISNKAIKIASKVHGLDFANHLIVKLSQVGVTISAIEPLNSSGQKPSSSTQFPELDAAIKQFEELQKQLAPFAFQRELLGKAEAAMKQSYPNLWEQLKNHYQNVSNRFGHKVLEGLRHMDKAKAHLKRSIWEAEIIAPKTKELDKILETAHKLVMNPERIKEDAIEKYLSKQNKLDLYKDVQKLIKQGTRDTDLVKDVFSIVAEFRNPKQSLSEQMRVALFRWHTNPVTAKSPMSESCKKHLNGMTSFVFRESTKNKVEKIIDAVWNGNLRELFSLDPEIGQLFAENMNTYQPLPTQMELALFNWESKEATKKMPMSTACKAYLRDMASQSPHPEKLTQILATLWKGNLAELVNLDLEVGKFFTAEGRNKTQPIPIQMELALVHWQTHPATKITPMSEANKACLREIAAQSPPFEKITLILTTLWHGDLEGLYELTPKVREQFIRESKEKITECIKELYKLQPMIIKTNDEVEKCKINALNKAREIFDKGTPTVKDNRPIEEEHKALNQAHHEAIVRIEKQFNDLNETLQSIKMVQVDFDKCQSPEEITEKVNQLNAGIDEFEWTPELSFAQSVLDDAIKEKKSAVEAAAKKHMVLNQNLQGIRAIKIDFSESFSTTAVTEKMSQLKASIEGFKSEDTPEALVTAIKEKISTVEALAAKHTQLIITNEEGLKKIQELPIDFSKCINIKQLEDETQKLKSMIEGLHNAPLEQSILKKAIERKLEDIDQSANQQIRVILTQEFKDKHKAIFDKDKQGFGGSFRRTTVTEATTLEQSIHYAQESNNRTRQAFIDLGWMNKKGEITTMALALMKNISKEEFGTVKNSSKEGIYKKVMETLRGTEKASKNEPTSKGITK
jgi:hypothetical protein